MMTKTENILGYEVKYKVWYHRDIFGCTDGVPEDIKIISATPEEGVLPPWAKDMYDAVNDDEYADVDDDVVAKLEAALFDYENSQL